MPDANEARGSSARDGFVNNTPCRSCGFVYPFTGPKASLVAMRRALGGKCPACATGRQSPALGEQARRRDQPAPARSFASALMRVRR